MTMLITSIICMTPMLVLVGFTILFVREYEKWKRKKVVELTRGYMAKEDITPREGSTQQELLSRLVPRKAPVPAKTCDRFEIMDNWIFEYYFLKDGTQKIRAIDPDGKDLGYDFNSMAGAMLGVEMFK